jgi:D-alanyl-lipoteichoic acid acyltransferase DltB (MBOAT superfamily)
MALGGIWHGAGWTFLIWGLLHGAGLAGYRFWQSQRRGATPPSLAGKVGGAVLTFHFVLLGWIFFRAANLTIALGILRQIGSLRFTFDNATPAFLLVLTLAAAAHFVPASWFNAGIIGFSRTPALVQAVALALLAVSIRYVAATAASPFIYSKF